MASTVHGIWHITHREGFGRFMEVGAAPLNSPLTLGVRAAVHGTILRHGVGRDGSTVRPQRGDSALTKHAKGRILVGAALDLEILQAKMIGNTVGDISVRTSPQKFAHFGPEKTVIFIVVAIQYLAH